MNEKNNPEIIDQFNFDKKEELGAMHSFLGQAKRGDNEWWMYFVIPAFMFAGNLLGSVPLLLAIFFSEGGASKVAESGGNLAKMGIDTNLSLFLMLLTFAGTLAALLFGVHLLHKRPISTLIYSGTIRWNRVFYAAGVWLGFTILMEVINYMQHPEGYELAIQPVPFLIGMVVSLIMIPIQTSFEEICFRGWLMQGIGSLKLIRLIPILITGILFGAMHFANPEIAHYGLAKMMFFYISFGIFLGMITVLSDGLELALGLHAANNLYGSIVMTFTSSALQTNTIFRSPDPDINLMILLSTGTMIIVFFIFKQKFNFWNINTLFEKED